MTNNERKCNNQTNRNSPLKQINKQIIIIKAQSQLKTKQTSLHKTTLLKDMSPLLCLLTFY